MSTYDVRDDSKNETDTIVFWDRHLNHLERDRFGVMIANEGTGYAIESKEHALYLIKALNKAIELGWFEE